MAYEYGCDGIVLSNHGGRQMDTARSGIEVLAEVVDELRKRGMFRNPTRRFEIFVDGGVRRASDVLKAIALGATAGDHAQFLPTDIETLTLTYFFFIPVGLGRAFIYASSAYGQEGCEKVMQILNVRMKLVRNLTSGVTEYAVITSQDEFEMNMRLLGARDLTEIVPSMVDAKSLSIHVTTVPQDALYRGNCGHFTLPRCFLTIDRPRSPSRC